VPTAADHDGYRGSVADSDWRPIHVDDFKRAYAALMALRNKVIVEDPRPFWAVLNEIHEEYLPELSATLGASPVGDDDANREVTFALIVLEMMMQGRTEISTGAGITGNEHACAVEYCRNLTQSKYCLHHELELGSD
jgi:hypothetical protein